MLIQVTARGESYPHVMAGHIAFVLVGDAHQVGALSAQQLGNHLCGKSIRRLEAVAVSVVSENLEP